MLDSARKSARWSAYAIVALTLLAPTLGGSTTLWAQATIGLATGILFILAPPRRSLGLVLNILFVAIGAAALVTFLPESLFGFTDWRASFLKLGIQLPGTQSPQPWLTLESSCLLWLGLAWTYYLFVYEWETTFREKAWNVFCFGILWLAAILAFTFAAKTHVPFWPNVREFGFFPNRNQTSNVLGLAGVMIYANAFQHLQRGRKAGWMWLASLALICWALILNYSRAGIILFFSGAVVWHVWWLIRAKEDAPKTIAWVPLALLLALLLVAGGDTLLRFKNQAADFFSPSENGRLLIYRDALAFLSKSPVLGIGLGNFQSLFSTQRQFFISSAEAIHPESDWLWVAVEMGCVVSLLFLAGTGIWLRHCFPLQPGTWRGMRVAALICGILFALHGIFDVSAHRVGSLWPALFLASTAINPRIEYPRSNVIPPIFRTLGVCFVAIALWWIGSVIGIKTPPTTATRDRFVALTESAAKAENYDEVINTASAGLAVAPLNWLFYYHRGVAEAALYHPRFEVLRDFAAARYLLPNWPDLCVNEGLALLGVGQPDLAFDVWEEGMRRWPDNAATIYSGMFAAVKDDANLRDRWRKLAHTNTKCFLIFMRDAAPFEISIELERLFSEDPQVRSFQPADLKILFSAWYGKGDKLALAETLRQHPEWQRIAWQELARAYADNHDYRQAYETVTRFSRSPRLPEINSRESIESLAARFRISGGTEQDGLMLARAEAEGGDIDDALAILEMLSTKPKASPLVYYLQSHLWASKGEWQKAWQAIWQYEARVK